MGLFSIIKDFGTSIGVLAKLCDKTWVILDNEMRVSYVFKTNKKAHCIINGKTSIVNYDFISDSNTLIINCFEGNGTSYHLKYLDENALFLIDEENNEDMCFANNCGKIELNSKADVYRLCFSNQVNTLLNRKRQYLNYLSIKDVDEITNGLEDDDTIRCIEAFKKYIPDFDLEYSFYLFYYKKKYLPGYDGSFEDNLVSSIINKDNYYYLDKIRHPKESRALNLYIEATEDSIDRYR